MFDMCIYHKECFDGFTAAWAVYQRYPGATFLPAGYGDEAPDVTGRSVIIVDFSYPREVLERMHAQAKYLRVLDHHVTAQAALEGLDYAHFDMTKSGAMLAWEYIVGVGMQPPALVEYVQDRDLWRFALPNSKAINAYIMAHELDFGAWDLLAASLGNPQGYTQAVDAGELLLIQHNNLVQSSIRTARTTFVIADNKVPAVNAPYYLASDIGHVLSEPADVPFAAVYYLTDDELRVSLRSGKHGADVSEIAKLYGGGGHKHAAGFSVSRSVMPDFGWLIPNVVR